MFEIEYKYFYHKYGIIWLTDLLKQAVHLSDITANKADINMCFVYKHFYVYLCA